MPRIPPVPLKAALLNTPEIELWPAALLRARCNGDARALARARWVLRRKRDGRFLAADLPQGLLPLVPRLAREAGLGAALDALEQAHVPPGPAVLRAGGELPLHRLHERLEPLGIDADEYTRRTGLALVAEPARLVLAGHDRYRRPLWMVPGAAAGWRRMQAAALHDGIVLEAISGYRSHDYQLGIFSRKQARGQPLADILAVNAAPGFSEHHGGCAIDIGAPGQPPAQESFEHTEAFAWLQANACAHGFEMSYPRGNRHGIVYEPWHWRYVHA